jgi:hypothetical protein
VAAFFPIKHRCSVTRALTGDDATIARVRRTQPKYNAKRHKRPV